MCNLDMIDEGAKSMLQTNNVVLHFIRSYVKPETRSQLTNHSTTKNLKKKIRRARSKSRNIVGRLRNVNFH